MEMLYESGKITELERCIYLSAWEEWASMLPVIPTHFIMLDYSMPLVIQRLRNRGRSEEANIDVEYQTALRDRHLLFYIHNTYIPLDSSLTRDAYDENTLPCCKKMVVTDDYDLEDKAQADELCLKIVEWVKGV